jgi:hypothetical protein
MTLPEVERYQPPPAFLPKKQNLILFAAGVILTVLLTVFVFIHQNSSSPIAIGSASAPNPYWVIITAIWQTGILGGGAYFFLMIWVPYITQFDAMHRIWKSPFADFWFLIDRKTSRPSEWFIMQNSLFGLYRAAKHWPDHEIRFWISYLSKGTAFLILAGVFIAIVFSVGWKLPTSWGNLQYDLLFARSTKEPNSAHLMSYLSVPAIGLWVAWKFRTGDGLPNSYLGLIVSAFGVVIHEGEWIVGYYAFYGKYLTYATTYNVLGDLFFITMLYIFFSIYRNYPFQQIPLRALKWVAVGLALYLLAWAFAGYHISTANNFLITKTQFNVTQWWGDTETNAWEVGSWLWTYLLMVLVIVRIKAQRGVMSTPNKDPLVNKNE